MKNIFKDSRSNPKLKFEKVIEEVETKDITPALPMADNELILLLPFGLSVGNEMLHPVMIFKSPQGDVTLPVLIDSLEAGVTLAQSNKGIVPLSPHKATQQIFVQVGVCLEKAVFVEVQQNAQYLKIFFTEKGEKKTIKVKASDAISLCLHLEIPIYTTKEVVVKSRVLVAEFDEMKREMSVKPNVMQRNHPYIN